MNEQRQITYMQVRISRIASRRWNMPLRQVMELFSANGILEYIRDCFDYFHLEGDDAVFEDMVRYLQARGVDVSA